VYRNFAAIYMEINEKSKKHTGENKAYSETLNETAVSFLNNYGNCVGDFGYICCNGSSENHSFPNVSLPFLDQPSVNFKDKSNGFW